MSQVPEAGQEFAGAQPAPLCGAVARDAGSRLRRTRLLQAVAGPFLWLKDHPVIYRRQSFQIVGFGFFAALSVVAMGAAFQGALLYRGLSDAQMRQTLAFFPALIPFVWFFARLVNLLFVGREVFRHPRQHLTATGFNVHGGILGSALWGVACAGYAGVPWLMILDCICLAALLGQAVGRVGCFNYGCCYGRPTDGPLAVRYTHTDSKIVRVNPRLRGIPIHPVQLYTSVSNLLAFGLLALQLRRAPPHGYLCALFLLYFGVNRLILERVRGDLYVNYDPRGKAIPLTGRISLAMVAGGIALVAYLLPALRESEAASSMSAAAFLDRVRVYGAGHAGPAGAALAASAVLAFLGFGVHGSRLGVFPFFERMAARE